MCPRPSACLLAGCLFHTCVLLVPSGSDVNITCERPGSGWPLNGFTVTVTATAGDEGCSNTNFTSTTVAVTPKSNVIIEGLDALVLCSDAENVTVPYTLSSGPGDKDMTVSATAGCTVSPSGPGRLHGVFLVCF